MLIEKRIPVKYMFKMIKKDVLRVLFFSISFHVFKLFFADYLPKFPLQLASVLGTSISLILAFKLSQSYDRWWEARKIWGAIVNDSRILVLELKAFLNLDDQPEYRQSVIKKIAYRQIGWSYSLGKALRHLDAFEDLDNYISEEDLAFVKRNNNRPYGLLSLHMHDLKSLLQQNAINPYQQVQMSGTVARLCDSMGKCERINNTIFPVTYRLFVHFFIYLFLVVLSLALVESIGILEIPILVVIASTFFLLEKTANHLQDPFRNRPTDTPMTSIARGIEISIKQVIEEEDIPEPQAPEKFYMM